jgi:hypothetical protein
MAALRTHLLITALLLVSGPARAGEADFQEEDIGHQRADAAGGRPLQGATEGHLPVLSDLNG